jgi:hypothetical protein
VIPPTNDEPDDMISGHEKWTGSRPIWRRAVAQFGFCSTGIVTVTGSGRPVGDQRDWRHEEATRPAFGDLKSRIATVFLVLPPDRLGT